MGNIRVWEKNYKIILIEFCTVVELIEQLLLYIKNCYCWKWELWLDSTILWWMFRLYYNNYFLLIKTHVKHHYETWLLVRLTSQISTIIEYDRFILKTHFVYDHMIEFDMGNFSYDNINLEIIFR